MVKVRAVISLVRDEVIWWGVEAGLHYTLGSRMNNSLNVFSVVSCCKLRVSENDVDAIYVLNKIKIWEWECI